MNNYNEVVYGNYPKSDYPDKLVDYITKNYFSEFSSSLLEIGHGNGTYTQAFKKKSFFLYGIDKDCEPADSSKHFFKKCDIEREAIPFTDNAFEYIFCKSVIEHISNTDNLLSEIYRVLKPNGTLLILTPAWEYNYKDFYNDYTHVKPFHRKGLQDALKIHNFKNVEVKYFYHLPFLWKYPELVIIAKFLSLFSKWKWKDKEETIHRTLIRFSQEVQLLAIAKKR